MREFKVGDRVRLSEAGRSAYYDGHSNPHDEVGVIAAVALKSHSEYGTTVKWSDLTNFYLDGELTHAEPVPIGYTGKLKDMDLQAGDVVQVGVDEFTFSNVIPDEEVYGGEYEFCIAIMHPCDEGTLISRATDTAAPTWSDWMLSRKDGTMTQQFAEVQTVSLDDTSQVIYRGRGVAHVVSWFTFGDDVYSVTLKDGVPDWSTVVHIDGEG